VWEAAHDTARYSEEHPAGWLAVRRAVEGLAGIVQGLIDFEKIGVDELSDVFDGIVEGSTLLALHKGTLVTVEHEDRPMEKDRPEYYVSPYLFLPQALLLHNEALLDRANRAWKVTVKDVHARVLQDSAEVMQTALDADFLPNVFHYPSERKLYKHGHKSRAINERASQLRMRLREVNAKYEFKIASRRTRADDIRNLFLLILSYTSLRQIFPTAPTLALLLPLVALALMITGWSWSGLEWRRLFRKRRKATSTA
jgi:hypothetical protein